jgi:hypothetical protein
VNVADADVVVLSGGGILLILGAVVVARWLARLQRAVDDHAERIAYLEARAGRERRDT